MGLLNLLEPRLASIFLREGCQIVCEREEAAFGNAVVLMQFGGVSIRVVRDRGDIIIEFGRRDVERWYLADHLLEFIVGGETADVINSLAENFQKVIVLVASHLDQQDFVAFQKAKADAVLQRIFPARNAETRK